MAENSLSFCPQKTPKQLSSTRINCTRVLKAILKTQEEAIQF